MTGFYLRLLYRCAEAPRYTHRRVMALAAGMLVFIFGFPLLLFLAGQFLNDTPFKMQTSLWIDTLAIFFMITGLVIMAWAALSLWKFGGGTPAPVVPTVRLVTGGPFRFCRNPMKLGASVYYLGIGTLLASPVVGMIGFFMALLVGSAYHAFVEEKELLQRFGEEYRAYRNTTPFLIPRIPLNRFNISEGAQGKEKKAI